MEVLVHMQSCHRCVVYFFSMCSGDVTVCDGIYAPIRARTYTHSHISTHTKTHVSTQIHAPVTFLFPGIVNMFLVWIRTQDNNTNIYVCIWKRYYRGGHAGNFTSFFFLSFIPYTFWMSMHAFVLLQLMAAESLQITRLWDRAVGL